MKMMTSHGLEKFMSKRARGEPEAPPPRRVRTINPKYSRKVVLPWSWIERLQGASGQTYALALCVRHNDWKRSFGRWDLKPFNLTRNMVAEFEVSDRVKPVALRELEARGLVGVEWHDRKNPVLTWVLDTSATK
jgi:hypothetical protein